MSLYSSIAVPDEERRPIKRPGFTGLYDEPSTAQVIEAPPVMYEREPTREVNSKPNAALRFAPKRRPQAKQRKQAGNGAAPRLEVTNSFDEFRDYQPESRSPDDRRPQKDEDEWDEEYDPANPIDYYDYLSIKADDDDAYQEYREARRRRELGIVEEEGSIEQAVQDQEEAVQETINEPKSSFAKRYMSSLGWKAGQGLGSQTQGRATPLFVQKYKGTAKVIDRHITPALKLQSRVVVFQGVSLSVQEIGDACSAFGTVERIIQREEKTMVQFVDGLSSIKCHAQGGALFHCDVRFGNDEKFEFCMRLLLLGTVLAIPLVPIGDSAVDVNVTPSSVSVNVGSDPSGTKPDDNRRLMVIPASSILEGLGSCSRQGTCLISPLYIRQSSHIIHSMILLLFSTLCVALPLQTRQVTVGAGGKTDVNILGVKVNVDPAAFETNQAQPGVNVQVPGMPPIVVAGNTLQTITAAAPALLKTIGI